MVLRGAPPPPPSVLFSPVPSRWQDLPPIFARQDELEYDKCYALFLRSYATYLSGEKRRNEQGHEVQRAIGLGFPMTELLNM